MHRTILILSLSFLFSCGGQGENEREKYNLCREVTPVIFELSGQLLDSKNEFSGLDWYKEKLVLLPQYPQNYKGEFDGALFTINKSTLDSSLAGLLTPLPYNQIGIEFNGLDEDLLDRGSGFEAIAFNGEEVFLTLESRAFFKTVGFVIKGKVMDGGKYIKLFPETLSEVSPQTGLSNLAEETIFLHDSSLISVYEANGLNLNPNSIAMVFDLTLKNFSPRRIKNVEYRITDATSADSLGRVWMINYLWPNDRGKLNPAADQEFEKFGIGLSHKQSLSVERLLEFQVYPDIIKRTDNPPVYIKLNHNKSNRNWEGIVRFREGFLVITDEHPKTILAYIGLED